jgi:hypothetical protein
MIAYHVVPHPDGWAVRLAGASRVTSTHALQSDAEEAARKLARKRGGELIVHGRGGQIRARNSYGGDPASRKG